MTRYTVLLSLLLFSPLIVAAETEREACKRLAPKYATVPENIDAVLPDESRVDLLSPTHAWEVDWAPKWAEGVGQAMLYSIWTGKKPGLILLVKDRRKEKAYILRAKLVCEKVGIELRTEKADLNPIRHAESVGCDAGTVDGEVDGHAGLPR